jgi:predicted PurR-regulated permease PerM
MGFVGLFVGPVLMALLVAIWREWLHETETTEIVPASPVLVEQRETTLTIEEEQTSEY